MTRTIYVEYGIGSYQVSSAGKLHIKGYRGSIPQNSRSAWMAALKVCAQEKLRIITVEPTTARAYFLVVEPVQVKKGKAKTEVAVKKNTVGFGATENDTGCGG